jgi:hypothetical protein
MADATNLDAADAVELASLKASAAYQTSRHAPSRRRTATSWPT